MKITVRKTDKKAKKINWKKLNAGTIFVYADGVIGLRTEKGVLLLDYGNGESWLEIALTKGYLTEPIETILGTLDEVIVI